MAAMTFTLLAWISLAIPVTSIPYGSLNQRACENTAIARGCWGQYSIDTDYYEEIPDTGVTREYWLSAESSTLAPDGYQRQVLVMNGSLPGPTIEADWGDQVVIHVTNNMQENGTSIHWHGIRQLNTNPSDGVPGVTECPIPPGESTTYRFHATQYGTSWYHSHFSLQLAEGLLGPIVIHGPATADYDVDVGPVVLQDWFHGSAFDIWEESQRVLALIQPVAENGLINGMNVYDCSDNEMSCVGTGQRFETSFEPGKKYLFRVIGAQTDGYMKFAIDNHKLNVIASDFVPIQPYETDAVILSSGQRYDVVVEANQNISAYWIRAIYQTACNFNDNDSKDNILGVARYDGTNTTEDPTTTVSDSVTNSCGDEPYGVLVPYVAHQVGDSDVQESINLQWYYEVNLVFHWTLRSKTLIVNWSDPTVLDIYNNETSFPDDSNVVTVDDSDQWVYWIVQDLTIVDAFHPMHLHGHDFYILAQGEGLFIPGLVSLNTDNPPRRDTASLYGNGYMVIAFKMDNPGSWLFHCHIAWHASQGLALQLVERTTDIPAQLDGLVEVMEETCSTWDSWYETSEHQQDDSGI
ncbi:Cupredoxin [Xylariaceae sp. FL0016]|nr:Cupredoxin [Xylariaceae sp. FL0016]